MSDFSDAFIARNPAWIQLLGLCPLLAVSNSVANALGLALASTFVVVGSNVLIAAVRGGIPEFARLPVFVLIIATFTTLTTLLLEAYAYELYLKIALFVQIIVTNCMILGRAEAFASKQPVGRAFMDALGTGLGFAVALLILGAVREVLGQGTLFAELDVPLGTLAEAPPVDQAQACDPHWIPVEETSKRNHLSNVGVYVFFSNCRNGNVLIYILVHASDLKYQYE